MNAAAPGWTQNTITDGVRTDGAAATFEVLVRRRPRTTAVGNAASTVAAGTGLLGPQTVVAGGDSQCPSPDSGVFEAAVSPGEPARIEARSQRPMGSPESRPRDCAEAGPSSGAETPKDAPVRVVRRAALQRDRRSARRGRRGLRRDASCATNAPPAVAAAIQFGDLVSMQAMGTGRAGIIVGFDTEFTTTHGVRLIDSYQFAVPDPLDPTLMVEVVILPAAGSGDRISLHTALWEVVVAAGLWRSPLVPDVVGPRGVHRSEFWSEDPEERREALAKLRVPIVLAAHYGNADLTAFRMDRRARDVDHLTRLTSAGGGLVTLLPFRMQRGDAKGRYFQALSVTVRDTMAHAPAGSQTLRALGDACGVPKIDVPEHWLNRMSDYRAQYLTDFLDYGMNDAVIVVEYLARLWGDGVVPPITLSGGAAAALVASGSAYFEVADTQEFRRKFAGLLPEQLLGFEVVEQDDKLSFYAKRGREPVDGAAAQIMAAFAKAYHGGLNSCPMPGFYPFLTWDIDAQNAYPTGMGCTRDLDYETGAIERVVHERRLTLDDVPEAATLFVGFVSFIFPVGVAFPTLPILADGTLIYPRTSDGVAGTWVCGPELHLALKLGAEVFCQIGYVGRELKRADGTPSLSLRHGVKQLIDDRNTAKAIFGKGSIEEKTLKTGVNSVYGKTAQDVAEQHSWDARKQEYDDVGGSTISSPAHAATTTSFVRAQLLAALNQITERGGRVYSVTTDGFITDLPVAEVEALDLYGIANELRESRAALTGDPSIWEAKHSQTDLVNFTTRGNVSQHLGGVCAHNGLKAPKGIAPDSADDREYLLRTVVTREGRVANGYRRFPSFQELSRREDRRDFIPAQIGRSVSMDYDLKRSPVVSSMTAAAVPLPDGTTHEMATFTTEPWENVEDALRAREIAREMAKTGCLRTVGEWHEWHLRFAHGKGRRITTPQRAVLMSLVIAHRQGVVTIPTLADRALMVGDRLAWLAEWGLGTVSKGDWDNARRPERVAQMLPLDLLTPYLDRMLAMASGDHPSAADRLPY